MEIDDLIDAYEKRNSKTIRPFVLKKGKRVLMYIASDPFHKYITDRDRKYFLNDGNNRYSIRFKDGITEIVETEDRERDMKDSWNELIIND